MLSYRGAAAIAGGLLLAVLSFVHAAAQVGLNLPVGALLGPNFHAWEAEVVPIEARLVAAPNSRLLSARLSDHASRTVRSEPLALIAWRGLGRAAQSSQRQDQARAIMRVSNRLSRRDPAVQGWLIDDAIRRGQIAATLSHFDAMARTEPALRPQLLSRMASVLGNAAARRALVPFVRSDNPWFVEFTTAAVSARGSITPFADLLLVAGPLPDTVFTRQSYAGVVQRLVRQGEFDRLYRLYPKLPGADASDRDTLSLLQASEPPYPPLGWSFASEPDRGGQLVRAAGGGSEVELFAEPLITGVVLRRLIWPSPRARSLRWQIVDREAADDASARIAVRCLDAVSRSDNLFAAATPRTLALPPACPVAMIEVTMFGGNGVDTATIVLSDLVLSDQRSAVADERRP